MKKKLVLTTLLLFCVMLIAGSYASAFGADLIVKVTGLRNTNGYVVCHLFNSEDGYPTTSSKAWKVQDDYNISEKTAYFIFKDIPQGDYAFTVHHDENANHKMDKNWLGLPKEGWACSNNAKGTLGIGPPSFDDAKITLDSNEKTVYVEMNY